MFRFPGFRTVLAASLFASGFAAIASNAELLPPVSVEERVETLLGSMDQDEKLALLSGTNDFWIPGNARLGIPNIVMADGPVGIRKMGPGFVKSTAYPASIALAATWNPALARAFGEAMGREARSRGIHILLGPGLNIYRHPLCGRNFEYLGEDPCLAGCMAASEVRGIQSLGVAATLKHFAANNQEYDRNNLSSDLDEATLRQLYLPAFETAVREGGAWCVMAAYNKINGVYAAHNALILDQILKKEWGFQGVAMSDWGAMHDTLAPANGGLDLEMPRPEYFAPAALKPLLESGDVTQDTLDGKVRRILRLIAANGWLDREQKDASIPTENPQNEAVALQMAREAAVLLKNDGVLPLDAARVKKIALIGPNAHPAVTGGDGSSRVTPLHSVSLQDALAGELGLQVATIQPRQPTSYFAQAQYDGPIHATLFDKYEAKAVLTADVPRFELDFALDGPFGATQRGREYYGSWTAAFTPQESGRYSFVMDGRNYLFLYLDETRLFYSAGWRIHEMVEAMLEKGRTYHVKVEGQVRPPFSPKFGWGPSLPLFTDAERETIQAADAALVCVGFGPEGGEGEGFDRAYALPGRQAELIRETAALNPRTVVLLNAGGSVATADWVDRVPALLHTWYLGQEGGRALAELLFGVTNPSGKLPISWERKLEDAPAFGNYPTVTTPRANTYKEDQLVGYRWYDRKAIEPLFPFGHGLSYTRFEYSALKVRPEGDGWLATLEVTNAGQRAGAETVQLYVRRDGAPENEPVRELKGFAKVELAPEERKPVEIRVTRQSLLRFDPAAYDWIFPPEPLTFEAGASSRDIRSTAVPPSL